MKNELIYNKESINYLNSLLKKKFFKGLIVVTGQNIITGGPWTVLNDSINHLAAYKKDYLIIVILFKRLEKKYENVINIICKNSKKSWIHRFVYEKIKCDVHLASISGGTDILCCFVLGCPILPVFEGEIQVRGLGMDVVILDEDGNEIKNQKGELCCKNSFPSMPIKFWRDIKNKKNLEAYFNKYKNIWRHGDWATLTKNNGIIIHGRSDATLNPSGVRIGTSEIYRIVESLDAVNESLVVGQDIENDVRIILFLKLEVNKILNNDLIEKIKNKIKSEASPRHVPSVICQVNDIPRTRSGKITELAVRDIIHGKSIKNTEALENPECLDEYKNREELQI